MERTETWGSLERETLRCLSIGGGVGVAEPYLEPAVRGHRLLALDGVLYSIQLPESPGEAGCAICGLRFLATGPTGHADGEPICDLCLLVESEELGIVLALVSVVRAFAVSHYENKEEYWEALGEVGAFGRIYERVASRSGPPRLFLHPRFTGRHK